MRLNVQLGHEKIGEICEFLYLGSKIARDGRSNADIRSKIGQTKTAFVKIPQLLTLRHLDMRGWQEQF